MYVDTTGQSIRIRSQATKKGESASHIECVVRLFQRKLNIREHMQEITAIFLFITNFVIAIEQSQFGNLKFPVLPSSDIRGIK